ncbi:hypothetical protein [Vibrio kanaloae]|uniref:hypothetical protein n=1 Tax=Vibrio kanaloae TaxID=170673 RepID=UPI0009893066|nr:hypothetical protein [Vibrio kanaloae]QPK03988.1 hypothetical protein BTD91_12125 [Vibrio kanaloae]
MSDKLTIKEKRDLVLQSGMQLIPYVGGSMASMYFGTKQEKRFKRLEAFYQELADEMKGMRDSVRTMEDQDPIALEAIMESLHEKIEVEPTYEKRQFFKSYFKNTLKHPVTNNYDERKYFLDSLGEMSLLECEILAFIKNQPQQVQVGSISKPGVEQYAIVGIIGRLKSRGFLVAAQGSFSIGGGADNSLQELVAISSYGQRFCTFCLDA